MRTLCLSGSSKSRSIFSTRLVCELSKPSFNALITWIFSPFKVFPFKHSINQLTPPLGRYTILTLTSSMLFIAPTRRRELATSISEELLCSGSDETFET